VTSVRGTTPHLKIGVGSILEAEAVPRHYVTFEE
jgi:hypothetical protein